MKVIKRDGREVPFERGKIEAALASACADVPDDCLSRIELEQMAGRIEKRCETLSRSVSVEELQDMVIAALADSGHTRLALHYSEYRLRHEMLRKQNSTDAKVLALLRHDNELAKQENANKDPIINSTMRDYLASEVSLAGKYGPDTVYICKVIIGDMDFEPAYNQAIQAKSIAAQNQAKAEIENQTAIARAEAEKHIAVRNAEADAEKKRIAAEAEADQVRIIAEAQADANRKLQESLTDDLIEMKKVEAWDGKLPQVMGSGADTLLGIDIG